MKTTTASFKRNLTLFSFAIIVVLTQSCQKNPGGNGTGTGTTLPSCKLYRESVTGGPGYVGYYDYHYDDQGFLQNSYFLNPSGGAEVSLAIGVDGNLIGFTNGPNLIITHKYVGDLRNGVPSTGGLDIADDGNASVNLNTYIFSYNADSTLKSVGWEAGELTIGYDANKNVSSMIFYAANGPRVMTFQATMEDYDDKPNPFVLQGKWWKFLQHMFSFDYPTDYLMVAALSQNNPGKITLKEYSGNNNDYTTTVTTMDRYYNNDGLTQSIVEHQQVGNNPSTVYQSASFEYTCK